MTSTTPDRSEDISGGSGETRDAAIRAAIDLFGRHGYEATSMRQIAHALGMKAPSLYNHFASKEELFVAALTDVLSQFTEAVLDPIDPGDTSIDQLMGVVRRYVLFELGPYHSRTAELLLEADRLGRFLPDDMREGIRTAQRRIYQTVRDLAVRSSGEDAPSVDGAVLAWTIITTCHRVGTWFNSADRLSREDVADNICRLVLHLLGQPRSFPGDGTGSSLVLLPSIALERRPRRRPESRR
jgi:AcrR family transcriptional regulator